MLSFKKSHYFFISMKAIRITTLGYKVTLIFLQGLYEVPKDKYLPIDCGEYAFVLPDTRYTLSVVTGKNSEASSELIRSIKAYLGGVCAFPSGEYDMLINGKEITYTIENKAPLFFGGNVGKCKLLSSNTPLESKNYPLLFSEVSCDEHLFRISKCHAVSDFDLLGVGSAVCRQTTQHEPPCGFMALSVTGGKTLVGFYRFGSGIALPTARAISAAACFLLGDAYDEKISFDIGGAVAVASIDRRGVASLYTREFSFEALNLV